MFLSLSFVSLIDSIFTSNSSTFSPSSTVRIFALPSFISFISATLYNLLLSIELVYLPKIPLFVFSNIVPSILSLYSMAFFSPGSPLLLRVMLVIEELKRVPPVISIIFLVLLSIISCPKHDSRSKIKL